MIPQKKIFLILITVHFCLFGCISNRFVGIYSLKKNSIKSNITELSLIEKDNATHCFFEQMEFIGKSTVVVTTQGIKIPANYVIDGHYLRIQLNGSYWLFKIMDINNLMGEGMVKGEFVKNSKK